MITGITIIGDIIRPDGNGRPGGADRPTNWMYTAIKRSIQLACRLPVSVLTTAGQHDIRQRIELSRSPEDAALHWAANYQNLPERNEMGALIGRMLQDRFCVGYELPPYMIHLLNKHEIPWIDLRIHPVRFLDDLLFAVRSSDAATQEELVARSVPEAEIVITAGLREAMCQLISDAAIPARTLLVVGQRPMDSSQIIDRRFFNAYAHEAGIASVCAQYDAVILKPHPFPDEPHSLLVIAAAQPNVQGIINDNIYRMLALPQVSAVLTVNSSVAYEAGYFGKDVHTLAPLPIRLAWRGDKADRNMHASVDDRVMTGDFWRTVLAPHIPVTCTDGVRLSPKPNRLRIALDSFWNYQQIDTDRIPAP